MGYIARAILLLLAVNVAFAAAAFARPVFLADGGVVEAESVWQSGGKVYVQLNRESMIAFYPHEVDLKKTFDKKWERSAPKPPKKAAPPVAVAPVAQPPVAEVVPVAPDEPAVPEVSTSAAPSEATPIPVETAPAQAVHTFPPPAAVERPIPTPRPDVTPMPVEPEFGSEEGAMAVLAVVAVSLIFVLVLLVAVWKVFVKAGQPGWKSLVPIYNLIVFLEISGTPLWWIVLWLIPIVNVGAMAIISINLARRFGKGTLYGLGLCFLGFIFYPHLAFSRATYQY